MTSKYYSDQYTLNQDNRTYAAKVPTNLRPGESVWIKAKVTVPVTGRTVGDVLKFGPVAKGVRPVAGQITASGANGSLTIDFGYTSAPTGIISASTAGQSAASTALTAAQIAAAVVSTDGDELIGTLGGTVGATATDITLLVQLANVGS
jgi:hypothetical protein